MDRKLRLSLNANANAETVESGNKIVALVVWVMSIENAGHNKSHKMYACACLYYKTSCEPIEKVKCIIRKKLRKMIIFEESEKKINYDISGRGVSNLSTYSVFAKVSK